MNRICNPHVLHLGATFTASTPCIADKPNEERTSDCVSTSMQFVGRVQDCNNSVHNEPIQASLPHLGFFLCPSLKLRIVTFSQTLDARVRYA